MTTETTKPETCWHCGEDDKRRIQPIATERPLFRCDSCGGTLTSADDVMAKLNDYDGDNIWEDVIYGLDYDEAATDAVAGSGGEDVVIGGVHYTFDAQTDAWSEA